MPLMIIQISSIRIYLKIVSGFSKDAQILKGITLSPVLTRAPLSNKSRTVEVWPLPEAHIKGVR